MLAGRETASAIGDWALYVNGESSSSFARQSTRKSIGHCLVYHNSVAQAYPLILASYPLTYSNAHARCWRHIHAVCSRRRQRGDCCSLVAVREAVLPRQCLAVGRSVAVSTVLALPAPLACHGTPKPEAFSPETPHLSPSNAVLGPLSTAPAVA